MRPSRPVVLVGVATAFSLLGDQTLYAVLPSHYTALGLLPYQVGLILSLNRWIRLLTNHLAERLCRRYSLTALLCFSLLLGSLLTVVYGTVSLFAVLLAARVLWGLCWSFIRQVGLMTVAESASSHTIGQMMGYYNGISRTGSMAGNFVGALGHDLFGYRRTLLAFGALSFVTVPLGLLARWGVQSRRRALPAVASAGWQSPGLLVSGFVVGCVGAGLVMSTLGLVLKQSLGDSFTLWGLTIGVATLTGSLLTGRWITDALGAPALGALSDRVGRRWGAMVFFGVGALALLWGSRAEGIHPLVLSVLLFFVCGTGAAVVTISEASTRGPRAVASYVTAADLGSAAGPVIGWMTQQASLSSDLIFAVGAGMYALAMLAAPRTFADTRGENAATRA